MVSRLLIVLAFVLFHLSVSAQLKKSYYGKYAGSIPAFEINTGMERFTVSKTSIEIQLSATELLIKIGNQEMKGSWSVLLEAKAYFVLVGKMENQAVEERIILYKRGKKVSREGIRPQPDAMLEKIKK